MWMILHRMVPGNVPNGSKINNNVSLTWSQGQMIPPKHIKRYPMATRHTQTTRENTRSSFLNTGSMQTRINIAKKIARAVGTVIKNATWSSTSWKQRKMKMKLKPNILKAQTEITYSKLITHGDPKTTWLIIKSDFNQNRISFTVRSCYVE